MGKREGVHLLLDEGGPMDIWREATPGSLHRRLMIQTRICDSPECDCRDVWVEGILLDDRYKDVEFGDQQLSYAFRPREGEPPEAPPLRLLAAAVDIDTGEVRFDASGPEARHDAELLGWLKEGMDENNLEKLRRRWRLAKGIDQDRWRTRDWSWWESGTMVSWLEVFPNEMNIIFGVKEDAYWVDDMYCINPGCTCKEAGLCFYRITTGKVERLGAIAVTLPSGRFSSLMSEEGDEKLLRRLWRELRKRHGFLACLGERMRRLKPIGQEIVRLSTGGKAPLRTPSREKVGRNDPCPCGSGKKAKKCCYR